MKTKIIAFILATVMVVCALPVAALGAFAPTTNEDLLALESSGVLTKVETYDYNTKNTNKVNDGNTGATATFLYLFKHSGEGVVGGKVLSNKTRSNTSWSEAEKAILITRYESAAQQVVYDGKHFNQTSSSSIVLTNTVEGTSDYAVGSEFYYNKDTKVIQDTYAEGFTPVYVQALKLSGDNKSTTYTVYHGDTWVDTTTFEVVAAGTAGAAPIAVKSDDNNNGVYSSNSVYKNVIDNVFVNTVRIQHIPGGVLDAFFNVITDAGTGNLGGSIDSDGTVKYAGAAVAKLAAGKYYDFAQVLYSKQVGTNENGDALYTWFCDLYIDGIRVITKNARADIVEKTRAEIDALSNKGKYRYSFTAKANGYLKKTDNPSGADIPVVLVKQMQCYYGEASKFTYTNYQNSGDNLEDIGFSMKHGEFKYNATFNLPEKVTSDSTAKIVATCGSAVANIPLSSLTPDAQGRYTVSLPVDAVSVNTQVKLAIQGANTYYISYRGKSYTEISVSNAGDTVMNYVDFSTVSSGHAIDGNNGKNNSFIHVFDGSANGIHLNGAGIATNRQNVFYQHDDGENGKVLRFIVYAGTSTQITHNGYHIPETIKTIKVADATGFAAETVRYVNADATAFVEAGTEGAIPVYVYEVSGTNIRVAIGDKWAKYDAGSGTLVPVEAGTEGAVRIAVRADDGNNNFQVYRSNSQAVSLLDYTESISLRFRYLGERDVTRLISPAMHGSSVYGSGGIPLVTITASDKALRALGTPVAYLDTTRYYDIDFKLYTVEDGKDGNTQLYTLRFDLYLDGILVYTGAANSNYTKKPATGFTGNNTYRYTFISGFDGAVSHSESDKEVIYVKSLKDVVTPSDACRLAPAVNSGNTVEGYDLTLGSKLELNYYMNLLPDVVADDNAKVVFTIGDEIVAETKASELVAGVNGLYKVTCPVNSTQMASDIKMSIESTTREYKIYMNGVATDEHTYKVVDYAKYILAGEFSAETKALVKAMLNYGAMAQTYFAEKNGDIAGTLANADCAYTEVELNAANFGTGTVTGATEGMTATLVLDTDTVIKIYKDGALVGESAGITADKLDEDVEIGTVKVSVLTLAGKVPTEKTNFKNLAKALALYSQATEAYKAAQ